jgi:hypothetical protein
MPLSVCRNRSGGPRIETAGGVKVRTDDMPAEPFIPGVMRHAPPRRWSCCQHKAVSDASVLAAASGPRLMRDPGFHGAYRQILLCVRLTSYSVSSTG